MDNENKHIIIPDRGFKLPKHYFESFNDRLMQKINAKGTFAYNVNQAGFLVPINYFENLEHNIFDALKDQQITQKNGYIIPANYFEDFEDRLYQKMESEDLQKILGAKKESFKVPENYFEKIGSTIQKENKHQIQKSRQIKINFRRFAYAVAAMLIFVAGIFVFRLNQNSVRSNTDPFAALTTEELMTYAEENISNIDDQPIDELLTEEELNEIPGIDVQESENIDELIEYLQ